eukprot:5982444-Alexandrium_andersonii.AAC.1
MSASLVGSEMCIRDSCLKRCLPSVAAPLGPPDLRSFPVAGTGLPVALEAVSYTHLTLPTICSV